MGLLRNLILRRKDHFPAVTLLSREVKRKVIWWKKCELRRHDEAASIFLLRVRLLLLYMSSALGAGRAGAGGISSVVRWLCVVLFWWLWSVVAWDDDEGREVASSTPNSAALRGGATSNAPAFCSLKN